MNETITTIKYAGTIGVLKGNTPRRSYEHQIDAMTNLNEINKKDRFNALLVLPTGGGKTYTAASWLLKNAIDKNKKIIWIAHRKLLLEQAAETFQKYAYSDILINKSCFKYRIVSGTHDKPIHIKSDDDILIVSKDSIIRNLDLLNKWLKDEEEIYLVIDEAHHATAKSYRRIIDYVKNNAINVKLLGLTATPFRTAQDEQGLLAKIFTDDIIYKIDLKDLIKKGILSRPEFEECNTEILIGDQGLGLNTIKSIEMLDNLPEDIANEIANNMNRNRQIVERYINNKDNYCQTLVFAINRMHAFSLKALFEKYGVRSEVIVSGNQAEFIGIDISDSENERKIELYRNGEIRVLINVNILTEGADLPKTKTVFLTRPTVSSVLMTQMIGRALRGEKAGGTSEAYIVSFIDKWKENIAWVNAESIMGEECEFKDTDSNYKQREMRLISIAKIEEFARIMDESIDTSKLEVLDFIKRIPLGMYVFSFIDDDMERNHQVLVYDSTKDQYDEMIESLPSLFEEYKIEDEMLEDEVLKELSEICEETYFSNDMFPSYDEKDIRYILKFFAQKDCSPKFIAFDKIDREKLDIQVIAKEVLNKNMRESEKKECIDKLWEDENSLIKVYFSKKIFFKRQLQIEIDKLLGDYEFADSTPKIKYEERELSKMSLFEIDRIKPEIAKKIKNEVFENHTNENGQFVCIKCKKHSKHKALFQIDHIIPMSKGGLTTIDNLQLLCRTCNLIKGDRDE